MYIIFKSTWKIPCKHIQMYSNTRKCNHTLTYNMRKIAYLFGTHIGWFK